MSATPPDRCPVCSHDLGALPPPSRCPDCGFEYDEHTRVWRSGESWARLALVYTVVGIAAGLVITMLYRFSFDRTPYPALPLICALGAPALGLLFRRLVSGRISGRFVALTPNGILAGTRRRPVLVPWDDFQQLTEHRGVPKLRRRESPVLVPLDDIFVNTEELAAFRSELKQAARRHRRPVEGEA